MTDRELLRMCRCAKEAPAGTSAKAYDTLFNEMIRRLEKYRWHDLTEDPDDLPERSGVYWVCGRYGMLYREVQFWVGEEGGFRSSRLKGLGIIAWAEIIPFEEDSDGN